VALACNRLAWGMASVLLWALPCMLVSVERCILEVRMMALVLNMLGLEPWPGNSFLAEHCILVVLPDGMQALELVLELNIPFSFVLVDYTVVLELLLYALEVVDIYGLEDVLHK